jgi:hypothetical protein
MMVGLDDLTGAATFDTPLPPGPGTAIAIERLEVRNASASMEADTLRPHVAILPRELQGRIESSIGSLSASAKLEPQRPSNQARLAGGLAFSALHVRIAGGSPMALDLGSIEGAASLHTNLPWITGTAITIRRLQAKNASASIEADILRRYTRKMPAGLHGRLAATLETVDASGIINSAARNLMLLNANIRLQNLNAHSSVDGKGAFLLTHLTVGVSVDSRLHRSEPEKLTARGSTQWSKLSYLANEVDNLDAAWHVDGTMLTIDRVAAKVLDGQITGAPRLDLVSLAVPPCDFHISHIDVHKGLANISPEDLDAEGTASGLLHMTLSNERELSGYGDLAFDGPGILRVGKIPEVERMLVGSFGADMASLAIHDLERYPFQEGTLHLESKGSNSLLKVKFSRQPRTAADKMPPRKEIINGKEIWVGSLVVPKIDMTIPISGKSFAETLSMVSGYQPLIRTDRQQPGK